MESTKLKSFTELKTPRQQWTKAESRKLKHMMENPEMSIADVAKEFNRTEQACKVKYYKIKTNYKPKPRAQVKRRVKELSFEQHLEITNKTLGAMGLKLSITKIAG